MGKTGPKEEITIFGKRSGLYFGYKKSLIFRGLIFNVFLTLAFYLIFFKSNEQSLMLNVSRTGLAIGRSDYILGKDPVNILDTNKQWGKIH